MIKEFIQVRYASGLPLTPWQVQYINWPFSDEVFASKRKFDEALQTARAIASIRGLPIATPAHIAVADMVAAQGEAPAGFDYNFWTAPGAPADFQEAVAEVGVRLAAGLGYQYAVSWSGEDEGIVGE